MTQIQMILIITGCAFILFGVIQPIRSSLDWGVNGLRWTTGESSQDITWEMIHEYERKANLLRDK